MTDRSRETGEEARAAAKRAREERTLERRQAEAQRVWERSPEARREFAPAVGHEEHKAWQARIQAREQARGRVKDRDFGIEYELRHPDGEKVRYDYVDLKNHRIVDLKARASGESAEHLARANREQRERHIEAYRAKFGVTPSYRYSDYLSTRDLYADERLGRRRGR